MRVFRLPSREHVLTVLSSIETTPGYFSGDSDFMEQGGYNYHIPTETMVWLIGSLGSSGYPLTMQLVIENGVIIYPGFDVSGTIYGQYAVQWAPQVDTTGHRVSLFS